MIGKLSDWLDHRIGYRKLMAALLLEHVPGGAKWRYVWGSTLMFVFGIQLVTGLLLMLHYSPGDSNAWGSVYFIQYEMDFGWLIRGLHHFGSQTMVVLLGLHMFQVVLAGAQLPPREFNWWLGLALMGIVLGLSLTGYLLPWDQKGYYATTVATNIAGSIPGIGPYLQRIVVGGPEYGHHTLSHFFALHVGILPLLMIVLIVAHLAVFRRHGVTAPEGARGMEYFWPGQVFRDLVACMGVFAVLVTLVVFGGHGTKLEDGPDHSKMGVYRDWALAGQKGLGANLDAPADRNTPNYPARPEWYFLFLFQLLKYFEGEAMLIGTVAIPNGVIVLLALLPLLGYGPMRRFGHFVGVVVVGALLIGVGALTFLAIVDDSVDPVLGCKAGEPLFGVIHLGDAARAKEAREKAEKFKHDRELAEEAARRAIQLAHKGIPEEGARELLRNDPHTRGPRIFQTNCAGCHAHGKEIVDPTVKEKPKKTASDLTDFGSEKWIRGFLQNPADDKYFGRIKGIDEEVDKEKEVHLLTGMIDWRASLNKKSPEDLAQEEKKLDWIAAFLAQQAKPKAERDQAVLDRGLEPFRSSCVRCHGFEQEWPSKKREAKAPDLTGYGSAEWLRTMLMSPAHKSRYGAGDIRNTMPAFRPSPATDGPSAQVPLLEFKTAYPTTKILPLSDIERELLIRWLTNDDRVVFGGQPISGVKKKN